MANTLQSDEYLRQRALRVVNDTSGDYTMLTRTLAIGVLDLLDARDRGRRLAEDRFDSELAELRDEVLDAENRRARQAIDTADIMAAVAARVERVSRRIDALEAMIPGASQGREKTT